MNEDEGMKFWSMLLHPDIFNYLTFFPSELGSKDLNDYKSFKSYSYPKSCWLQPLLLEFFDIVADVLSIVLDYILSQWSGTSDFQAGISMEPRCGEYKRHKG